MANVLTDLAPDLYKAADMVGRELTGMITSVTMNADTEQAALNQPVRSFFTRTVTDAAYTPAMTIPEGTDQTIDNKTLVIDQQYGVQIPWTGEDIKYVNAGNGFTTIYGDQIKQAMRAIANRIEAQLCLEAKNNAGSAYGTSGTTPFASNFNDLAELRKLLVDRGCPVDDGNLTEVMNTAAGVKLRNLAQLQKANEAGGTDLLRQGTLLDLQGIKLKESAGIQSHTKGTGASYLVDLGAGYSATDKTIHVDTGTGTFVAGDIITFGGDTEKYVVGTGFAGDGDGDIVLNSGLLEAIADNEAVAFQANYTGNIVLHRSALELAIRAPASPFGGDAATDVMLIQDPFSGLVFEISIYKGFKKAMMFVAAVWGKKAWKPDFIAIHQG